jgi:hypothetical protein
MTFFDVNHETQFTSQHLLFLQPKVEVGHRFRYLNYDRQSRGGYFDPNDYYANRAFVPSMSSGQSFISLRYFCRATSFQKNRRFQQRSAYGGAARQVRGRFAIYFSSSA